MKNKICCLFSKLGDKLNNIDGEHYLAFFSVLSIIFLIAAMFLSPISASAADDDSSMILKAGTYRFNTSLVDFPTIDNTIFGNVEFLVDTGDGNLNTGVIGIATYSDYTNPSSYLTNGNMFGVVGDNYFDIILYFDGRYSVGENGVDFDGWQNNALSYDYIIPADTNADIVFATWFIANTNYNEINGGSPSECPTLEDQIANYNGSWTDFLMMLRQNNRNLANSYQNNIELAMQSGANSVTLEQRLSEFDGDWKDFERLMAEYNVDLQTMYTNYVNSLETQAFEDGNAYGQEVGYKEGYNSGLNKGQSDTFTKNFFTDFLGGVVEAIDSIHLYEHIREIDGGVSTVVEWYISPWTIFTSLICLIVVIIILKVWLGG